MASRSGGIMVGKSKNSHIVGRSGDNYHGR